MRPRTPVRSWLSVAIVSAGIFSVVTAEQLPIGLLVSISADLTVSSGTTGLTVTVPGLVAAISAPLVPVLAGRLDRRTLLVVLLTVMTAANAVSAMSPSFSVLFASRVLVGITIGGFWAVAGGLATRLVPAHVVGRATAVIFGGVAAANVFGVPLGTLVGDLTGWRSAFWGLAALGFPVAISMLVLMPSLAAARPVRFAELAAQLRNPAVLAGIIATLLIVIGHFGAYTYVGPVLHDLSGIDPRLISGLLFGFGAAGIAGNFIAGSMDPAKVRRTLVVIVVLQGTVLLLFPIAGRSAATGILFLALWGLAYGGVSVSLQTWMLTAAPRAVEAASALWVCVFNFSIAMGALLGGVVVDVAGLPVALWGAGAVVVLTLIALVPRPSGS